MYIVYVRSKIDGVYCVWLLYLRIKLFIGDRVFYYIDIVLGFCWFDG